MKTAMQQLMEVLDKKHQEMISKDRFTSAEACKMLKEMVSDMLPIEEKQLQDARIEAYKTGFDEGTDYGKSKL